LNWGLKAGNFWLVELAGPDFEGGASVGINSPFAWISPPDGWQVYAYGEAPAALITTTPEPSSLFLFGTGLLALATLVGRKVVA
jgi:hypothetical protein